MEKEIHGFYITFICTYTTPFLDASLLICHYITFDVFHLRL